MTVAADDITGRNECPEHMRITAGFMKVTHSLVCAQKTKKKSKRGNAIHVKIPTGENKKFESIAEFSRWAGLNRITVQSQIRNKFARADKAGVKKIHYIGYTFSRDENG